MLTTSNYISPMYEFSIVNKFLVHSYFLLSVDAVSPPLYRILRYSRYCACLCMLKNRKCLPINWIKVQNNSINRKMFRVKTDISLWFHSEKKNVSILFAWCLLSQAQTCFFLFFSAFFQKRMQLIRFPRFIHWCLC